MVDVKVSLTISLPGGVMISREESLKYSKVRKYNEKTGKPLFKYGQPVYDMVLTEDPKMHELNTLYLKNSKGKVVDKLHFYTRKSKPAYKTTHMSRECYLAMISNECPAQFRGPKRDWLKMKAHERLQWHMENYAAAFNGKVVSYTVYDD